MVFDPVTMGVAAAVTSAVGTGVSAIGSSQASTAEAQRMKDAAGIARTKGEQKATQLTEELGSTLANIRAVRAAAGMDTTGSMDAAIEAEVRRKQERNIDQVLANAEAEATNAESAMRAKMKASRMALISGGIGMVGGFAKDMAAVKKAEAVK